MDKTPTKDALKVFTEKHDIYFSEECPALEQSVYMTKLTWFNHVLKHHYHYMNKKEYVVKEAVAQIKSRHGFFMFSDNLDNSWFYDYKCSYFLKRYECLRVAFKRLESGIIILASAYPPEKGVFAYES